MKLAKKRKNQKKTKRKRGNFFRNFLFPWRVRWARLELAQDYSHYPLKVACLPFHHHRFVLGLQRYDKKLNFQTFLKNFSKKCKKHHLSPQNHQKPRHPELLTTLHCLSSSYSSACQHHHTGLSFRYPQTVSQSCPAGLRRHAQLVCVVMSDLSTSSCPAWPGISSQPVNRLKLHCEPPVAHRVK